MPNTVAHPRLCSRELSMQPTLQESLHTLVSEARLSPSFCDFPPQLSSWETKALCRSQSYYSVFSSQLFIVFQYSVILFMGESLSSLSCPAQILPSQLKHLFLFVCFETVRLLGSVYWLQTHNPAKSTKSFLMQPVPNNLYAYQSLIVL